MKARGIAVAVVFLAGTPALAHRLDEYLQATLISVAKDHVQAQLRLVPGVAVLPIVLAGIDADRDGVISLDEQNAYAERVRRDLSLTVDGDRLPLRLIAAKFPSLEEMKEGLGEIQIEFDAAVPRGSSQRRLILENRHQGAIAAYLVNCLVARDPDIRLGAQTRNYQQSFYQLDYTQTGSGSWRSGAAGLLGAATLLLCARIGWHRWLTRAALKPSTLRCTG